jgi:hypothetical protein
MGEPKISGNCSQLGEQECAALDLMMRAGRDLKLAKARLRIAQARYSAAVDQVERDRRRVSRTAAETIRSAGSHSP